MIMTLVLFENEFLNIVAISFTSLIVNELIMVALEITTWHLYMVIAEIVTLIIYILSMVLLPEYFGMWIHLVESTLTPISDLSFVFSFRFVWKVAAIVAVSSLPLYVYKAFKSRFAPANYAKLSCERAVLHSDRANKMDRSLRTNSIGTCIKQSLIHFYRYMKILAFDKYQTLSSCLMFRFS